MGRRARVTSSAAAVVMAVACCMSVMGRVLVPAPAARSPWNTHSWLSNNLSEQQEEEEDKEVLLVRRGYHTASSNSLSEHQQEQEQEREREREEVVPRRGQQTASSRLHQRMDNSPDYLFKSVLDYPAEVERLVQEETQDPEVTPGFFQGDMVGIDESQLMNTRVALKWEQFPERRWTNATVPYVISNLYGTSERQMILTALNTLSFLSCIKFVPWDEVATDYLLIWPMERPRGCWSFVGRKGGQQILSLQPPNSSSKGCFISLGKPIHELLHTLGVFHQQARPDRDDYIDIISENIISGYIHNFNKQSAENTTFPFSYDYNSVMHYGAYYFSFSRNRPTIVPKQNVTIGQRIMLSKLDCLKLNDLYGCLDDPYDREKYTTFCTFLGY